MQLAVNEIRPQPACGVIPTVDESGEIGAFLAFDEGILDEVPQAPDRPPQQRIP